MNETCAVWYIEWLDSALHAGWTDQKDVADMEPSECLTVGFLVEETDNCLKVAQSMAEINSPYPSRVDAVMVIPKLAITKRILLKEPPLLAATLRGENSPMWMNNE